MGCWVSGVGYRVSGKEKIILRGVRECPPRKKDVFRSRFAALLVEASLFPSLVTPMWVPTPYTLHPTPYPLPPTPHTL